MRTRNLHAALAAVAASLAVAGTTLPAGAQTTQPQPSSCAGVTFTDPAGDQQVAAAKVAGQSIGPPQKAGDNLDLIKGFLRYGPNAKGVNVMTGHLIVTNLSKTVEPNFDTNVWIWYMTVEDTEHFVRLTIDKSGKELYEYGTFAANQNTIVGTTTGKLYEGANGMIEMVIPAEKMGIAGKTVESPYGDARVGGAGFIFPVDIGPDTNTEGKNFKVTPCAEGGAPTQAEPGPTPPPGTSGGGTTGGGGGGGATTPGAGQPAPVTFTVTVPKLKAKKVNKTKKIVVTVKSSGKVTGLTASLLKGKKTLGSGKLAALDGQAKVSLKVKKKLKKGAYTLKLAAKDASGRATTGTVQVPVR
jgi:hypothetical protein